METDFYELLAVDRNASDDELKKAYRKLARELHPDANPNDTDAEERFKRVTLAYEVLRDPERRRAYDMYGIDGIRGTGATSGAGDPFGFGAGMNLGDLFDAFFGGASPFGGSGRRRQTGPPQGADIEATVTLDFEQTLSKGKTEITLRLPVACDTCSGTGAAPGTSPTVCSVCQGQGEVRQVRNSILGQMMTSSPCPRCAGTGSDIATPCQACRGEGRRTQERTYTVDFPAGIDRGQTLRLTGRGGAGPRGGPNGDLYVSFDVRPHDQFQRHGNDLVHILRASIAQAALGAHIVLPAFGESFDVYVDPGTQTGKIMKFRGKGFADVNGRTGRGDLIVQLVVETPTGMSDEETELLRRFADLRGENIGLPEHGLIGKIKDAFR